MATGTNEWLGVSLASGRYLVTEKLGEGGMGSVYRARDRNLDADVVIKVPLRSMVADVEFSRRFKDEIRSLVNLPHPHIVKVTDVGEWDGLPFAVMQYLPGGSLEDRRKADSGRVVNPVLTLSWLSGIAAALDYVHSRGYIHRDVKPGNILFDAEGHAFLGDFGVIKVLTSAAVASPSRTAVTGTGMVIGTVEYMAPELIMGESLDGRVDQYALAITVYEMLCGKRPFEDEVKTKLLVLHISKAPMDLCDVRPGISQGLSRAVLKGLAKDPRDRYANCSAFALAVSSAAVASLEKVRFKCKSCGKNLALSTADFERLLDSGRQIPCPACKEILDTTVGLVGPNGSSSGSMAFSLPNETGTTRSPLPGLTMPFSSQSVSSAKTSLMGAVSTDGPSTTAYEASLSVPAATIPASDQTGRLVQHEGSLLPELVTRPSQVAGKSPGVNRLQFVGWGILGIVATAVIGWFMLAGPSHSDTSGRVSPKPPEIARTPRPEPSKKVVPTQESHPAGDERRPDETWEEKPIKKKSAIVKAKPNIFKPASPPSVPTRSPEPPAVSPRHDPPPPEKAEPTKPASVPFVGLKGVTIKLHPAKDGGKIRTFMECVNSGKSYRSIKMVEIDYDDQIGLIAVAKNDETFVANVLSRKGDVTKRCTVFVPITDVALTERDK